MGPSGFAEFVHLRVQSSYSFCQSMLHPKQLVSATAQMQMPAIAITDRDALFGALEFSDAAAGMGVQPIIGVTIGVEAASGLKVNGEQKSIDRLLLICQSEIGWIALCKILSHAYLDSQDGQLPVLAANTFEAAVSTGGLLCLSGGTEALTTQLAMHGHHDRMRDRLTYLKSLFPSRLYIELQRCGEPGETEAEDLLLDAAYDLDIPIVATNAVCFLNVSQHVAHDVLSCIRNGTTIHDARRPSITNQHYLKTADEMCKLFADLPEAIANTLTIAKRCAFLVKKRAPILPKIETPSDDILPADLLRQQATSGLAKRFAQSVEPRLTDENRESEWRRYLERLEYELDVIITMGFADYYLIVSDFMQWALGQSIPVGVRGSGATSIVAWCMEITHIDPVRFNLVFERFLNPERVSLPDFDCDFCQERRGDVIDYVINKYGADRVAQIISFGKLLAKAAVRDAGRALGLSYGLTDKMARLIGNRETLSDALKEEPDLKNLIDADTDAKVLMSTAKQIEGLYRHASMHAAGVIIGDRPLSELVPLYRDPSSDIPVTQFSYKDCEKVGLVKFDFLGLRTLTIIDRSKKYITATGGRDIDVIGLDFEDVGVYEMLSAADTMGVFQLESAGMRGLLRNLQPTQIEQLIALISLYRPGPMDSIPSYIARAKRREEISYDHPMLEAALGETYGIITYQEDVMLIARLIAGYSMGEADLLRRAMGKKIKSEMEEHYAKIQGGARERGISDEMTAIIWGKCEKFVGYGFNKGHAAAYAQVSYQTAYLKFHYPAHFYAACMSVDIQDIERLGRYRQDLIRKGIKVLPPDVNESNADFKVEALKREFAVRYALGALKDVGSKPASIIEAERAARGPFTSLENFFSRLPKRGIAKSMIERLMRAGCFDSLDPDRDKLLTNLDQLMVTTGELDRAQNLFDVASVEVASSVRLIETVKRSQAELLRDELSILGFFWSGHPLDSVTGLLRQAGVNTIAEAKRAVEASTAKTMSIAALVHVVQRRRSAKTQKPYAFVTISDLTDSVEAMVFTEPLAALEAILVPGALLVCQASGQKTSDGDVRFQIDSAMSITDWITKSKITAILTIDEGVTNEIASQLEKELALSRGPGVSIRLQITTSKQSIFLSLPGRTTKSFNDLLALEKVAGIKMVNFESGGSLPL